MAAAAAAAAGGSPAAAAAAAGSSSSSEAAAPQTLAAQGREVPLTAEPGIDISRLVACVPFRDWLSRLDPEMQLEAIHFQSVDYFGPRVGFLKFKATVRFHGVVIPGIVFMRGGSVAILPLLLCEGERWVLGVRQPRVPCGNAAFLELPAGMLDHSGNFSGVAAKEMKEETGIEMADSELIDMTALAYGQPPLTERLAARAREELHKSGAAAAGGDSSSSSSGSSGGAPLQGMYPSVGACDEFIRLMFFKKQVSRAELEALQGKATGNLHEGEVITLELLRYEDLWRKAPDAKTLSAMLLYEKLTAAGLMSA